MNDLFDSGSRDGAPTRYVGAGYVFHQKTVAFLALADFMTCGMAI